MVFYRGIQRIFFWRGSVKHLWSPWRMKYIQGQKVKDCIFCKSLTSEDGVNNLVIMRGKCSYLILNLYPYTSGHLMVVSQQHASHLDQLDPETRAEMMELTSRSTEVLTEVYRPQGFNIGINIGEIAGAGIAGHIHIHVVPRWSGDTNFMTAVGETRVLPESIEESYLRIKAAWDRLEKNSPV
jgi:ATP adenylyltransferase